MRTSEERLKGFFNALGRAIQWKRSYEHITLQQLADLLHLTKNTVFRMEKSDELPVTSIVPILAMVDWLGVPIGSFFPQPESDTSTLTDVLVVIERLECSTQKRNLLSKLVVVGWGDPP